MVKKCMVKHISMPEDLITLIKKAMEPTGICFSQFLRQAAIEELKRLNIIGTKEGLTREVGREPELTKRA